MVKIVKVKPISYLVLVHRCWGRDNLHSGWPSMVPADTDSPAVHVWSHWYYSLWRGAVDSAGRRVRTDRRLSPPTTERRRQAAWSGGDLRAAEHRGPLGRSPPRRGGPTATKRCRTVHRISSARCGRRSRSRTPEAGRWRWWRGKRCAWWWDGCNSFCDEARTNLGELGNLPFLLCYFWLGARVQHFIASIDIVYTPILLSIYQNNDLNFKIDFIS